MIVYSALFGRFDRPYPAVPQDGVSWVLFTDTPEVEALGWTVHGVLPRFSDPRLEYKYWKMHPPPGPSIWIDCTIDIHDDRFLTMAKECLNEGDICAWSHPVRNCVYTEAKECNKRNLDKNAIKQALFYKKMLKYPKNNGLWASGVLARNESADVVAFNERWWRHILRFSQRDQVSMPVAAWETGINITPFKGTIENNMYVGIGDHRSW
jgi:hypothetical protein